MLVRLGLISLKLRILISALILAICQPAIGFMADAYPLLGDGQLRTLLSYVADLGLVNLAPEAEPFSYNSDRCIFQVPGVYIAWSDLPAMVEAMADVMEAGGVNVQVAHNDRYLVNVGGGLNAAEFLAGLPSDSSYPVDADVMRAALKQKARFFEAEYQVRPIDYLIQAVRLVNVPLAAFLGWGGLLAFWSVAFAIPLLMSAAVLLCLPQFFGYVKKHQPGR